MQTGQQKLLALTAASRLFANKLQAALKQTSSQGEQPQPGREELLRELVKLSSEILREQLGESSESLIASEAQAAVDDALDYYALMVSETASDIEQETLRGMSLSAESILTTDRHRLVSLTRFRKTALVQGARHEDAAAGAVMAGGLGMLVCALSGLAPLWVGFLVPFVIVVLLASLVFSLKPAP